MRRPASPIRRSATTARVDVIEGLPYAERMRNYAINSTPVVVKNVVIAGSNITDGPLVKEQPRGDIFGFDVRTGKKLWTFHSVPQKGEFGHDTWEDGSADYTGNTNVWSMITVDEELGYVYLPFGTPTNDYYGGHRPGNNLFAESLVCLDATTGKRVWHFQARASRPVGLRLSGRADSGRHHGERPAHQGRRAGQQAGVRLRVRSRTGEPVWPIEERPVPQSTAPGREDVADAAVSDQAAGVRSPGPARRRRRSTSRRSCSAQALEVLKQFDRGPLFTPPSERGTVQLPGNVGGADWGGAASIRRPACSTCRRSPVRSSISS